MRRVLQKIAHVAIATALLIVCWQQSLWAQTALRRPLSPSQPMWQVHIDVWNAADPQKIIDLMPSDIRPYVVMNVSMSINHNQTTGEWLTTEYGYETAKSWVRTCAENNIWCMVQQSSGGLHHFSETDLSVYEEFFKDYPNFLGFNYAEQFWGFDIAGDIRSSAWIDRMNFFAKLLPICNKYGGYLTVSWCGNMWSPNINPIGMMKRCPAFAQACRDYTENYILCEKYTQGAYIQDMESLCLGAYLSGYSGNYGIRYDATGWTGPDGTNSNFTSATGIAPHLEHIMLTGMTVIDGPETIPLECFKENSTSVGTNGYTQRNWVRRDQFDNVCMDIYRKVLDGTVRIPTRTEVINRTKYAIINNVSSGTPDDIYSSPTTLFEGLYRMDSDGNLRDNHSFFKKTGRYPTIPTVYLLDDALANTFQFKINKSALASRWTSIAAKQTEMNAQFPQEYTGTIYAGRHENGWVVYNPFKDGTIATGNIPLKYNTCSSVDLSFSLYTGGVIKETANKLNIYLNNYDNVLNTGLKTDIVTVNGCSAQPTYTLTDRGHHTASTVTTGWSNGSFTLTINHNGPLDLTINCSGTATGRLTAYTTAKLLAPSNPPLYNGVQQYEAEYWDYKSINRVVQNGVGTIDNYQALGYMIYGTNAAAAARETVYARNAGLYKLETRYSTTAAVSNIDLYVNGTKIATPSFAATADNNTWSTVSQTITLNAGYNTIEYKSTAARSVNMYFDNLLLTPTFSAPVIAITSPTNGSSVASSTVTITATATDADGTIAKVEFFNGTTSLGTGTVSGSTYTFSWTNVATGTYTVKAIATDNAGNQTSSAVAIVTVTSFVAPSAPTVTTPVTYCQNATATALTATGTSLKWYTVATGGTGSTTAPTPSTAAAGTTTYYVSQTVNNVESSRAAINVVVNAVPTATISVSGNTTFCQGVGHVDMTASSGTGYTYQWWRNGTTATGTGTATHSVYMTAGSYTVEIKDANGCKVTSSPVVITINPSISIALVQGWNLLSINVHPQDSSIATLFNGLNVQEIKTMDAFWNKGQTEMFNSLKKLTAGQGYLVKMNDAGTLTTCGAAITVGANPFSIVTGWQLLGCPYQTATPFTAYFNSGNCSFIKDFSGFWQPNGTLNSIQNLTPGKAYFITK